MSTACPACGGTLAPWLEVPAGEPSDGRRFPLLRCEACGSSVTGGDAPGPEAYEAGVYAPGAPRAGRLVAALQRATVGQPGRLLRRAGVPPGARVLDAGAGKGRLVEDLRRRGYDASGIDPSARSMGVATASIDDHEDSGLDAVVLWHVLEHLDDPRASLERVRAWLRPGGVVLVGVPNPASVQAALAGEGWLHWDAPRHRSHFTPAGLRALFARSGFELRSLSHLVWEHNPASMWMAMLSRLGLPPGYPFHVLKRNVEVRPGDLALLALGVPLAPVALATELVAAGARRGGTVVAVARAQ